MTIAPDKLQELVSLERGEIDRRIFSDPEIFEQEMKSIFARSWLFLCHESQIPKKGDQQISPSNLVKWVDEANKGHAHR